MIYARKNHHWDEWLLSVCCGVSSMVADNSPVYNEITLLESAIEAGILGPKRKWQAVVKKIDKYILGLETENKKLREPHIILDHFVPGLAKDEEPKKWGDDRLDGRKERQGKLGEERVDE